MTTLEEKAKRILAIKKDDDDGWMTFREPGEEDFYTLCHNAAPELAKAYLALTDVEIEDPWRLKLTQEIADLKEQRRMLLEKNEKMRQALHLIDEAPENKLDFYAQMRRVKEIVRKALEECE